MKNICIVITLVGLLVTACQVSHPPHPDLTPTAAGLDLFDNTRTHIRNLVAEGKVPSMAVAVAQDGEMIWEEGFGLADLAKKIPATEHTPYPLASVSKPLTASGLMILVERGLINLDSPINDYLGQVKLQARVGDAAEATVRRIASHTAGLPLHAQNFYDGEHYQPPAMDESIHRYGNLITAPGDRYQYSNLDYGILGYVISRVSSTAMGRRYTYAEFMRDEVFSPLGMDHTSVHIGPGLDEGQAVKYTADGTEIPPYDTDCPGASAIYSSVHDLIRFAMFHLKNVLPDQKAIISAAAIDQMQRPGSGTGPTREWERKGSGYGLGWFIGVTEEGFQVVQHSGGTVGVSTILALVPDKNLAVAVLSNTNTQWSDAILIEILCALLPIQMEEFLPQDNPAEDKPSFAPPPELIGSWKGFIHTYEGKVALLLEIGQSGDIYATLDNQPGAVPLEDISYENDFPKFMNAGDGPFLRGWIFGELETADVIRGQPTKLWLELKLRGNILNGALIAFSQKELYSGPLSHWVELVK